jgi:hypothetical protein
MWKVKCMNTARIVVLAIAVSAGGIAAFFASRFDNKPLPTEPVAQLQAPRSNDQDPERGDSTNVVRYGGGSAPMTTQK